MRKEDLDLDTARKAICAKFMKMSEFELCEALGFNDVMKMRVAFTENGNIAISGESNKEAMEMLSKIVGEEYVDGLYEIICGEETKSRLSKASMLSTDIECTVDAGEMIRQVKNEKDKRRDGGVQ